MNWAGLAAVVVYFLAVIGIGLYFFVKNLKHGGSEKEYFLGGRDMNGWVSALSAGASDMSAWVLMGLPGAICFAGMGQVWIAVGLLAGTVAAWLFVAPRLRRYSIIADDAITLPQFLNNRFLTHDKSLQVIAALVFMLTYCVYAASSIYACGAVFKAAVGMEPAVAMTVATVIIVLYTFLGGFRAVCWTDFFQGLLMLAALLATPIFAWFIMRSADYVPPETTAAPPAYFHWLADDGWASFATIASGLAWGLGYFGMPHILIRYFAVKSEREMRKSQLIGCIWITVILLTATGVGLMGRGFLGAPATNAKAELVFIDMVHKVFDWIGTQTGLVSLAVFCAGLLLSAILAASMSTADSQLLAASSAFASDLYKPLVRKNASDREMMRAGRIVVLAMAVVAYLIAVSPQCKGIMSLVSCAWAAFGSAFGPVVVLALYWRRLTCRGAVAGMAAGFCVDALWYAANHFFPGPHAGVARVLEIYELLPGFLCGLAFAVLVSLIDKPPAEAVTERFDRARKQEEAGK